MHESAGVHFSFQSVQEAHLVVFSPEFPQVDEIFTPESAISLERAFSRLQSALKISRFHEDSEKIELFISGLSGIRCLSGIRAL